MDNGLAILLAAVVLLLLLWFGITIGYRLWAHRTTLDDNRWTDDSAADEVFGPRKGAADDLPGADGAGVGADLAPDRHRPAIMADDAEAPLRAQRNAATPPSAALNGLRATPDAAAGLGRGALPISATGGPRIPQLPPLTFAQEVSSAYDGSATQRSGGVYLTQQQVLSVLLLPQSGPSLDGNAALAALISQQMHLGNDQFCHRYDGSSELDGGLLFSAAQLEPPGSLSRATLSDTAIAGLVLFISLPQAVQAEVALSAMIDTARTLAERLNAVVCDANRTNLTPQSINYMRQQINEFTRRQLLVS